MSEDNGFVERPARAGSRLSGSLAGRLRATADNGKAVPVKERGSVSGSYVKGLRAQGFSVHTARNADGTYLAWCERIEPVKAP